MNRFFTLLLAASCLTAVGQECVDDIYPPIFTGELVIPEGFEEDSYEIAVITLTYAAVSLHLSSETINFFDIEDPEWFMPIYEDNCTENLDLIWQQGALSGGCVGAAYRRYSFSDSNGNQTGFFDVEIQLYDDESPYIIQGPSDLTLDCSNSLYYQEALDWFESGGGIVAGDSAASFLEGSGFEYGPLDIVADYDVSAILSGQPTTIEISWQVIDQCGNMALATSLLTLECGSVVEGCMDELACNYSPSATEEDASCLYLDDCLVCGGDNSSCTGCLDSQACNYNDTTGVLSDPTLCDYSCCPGPGCCGAGTTWNWQTSECEVANPSDSNFDGCVQLNDLLDLLTAYGNCVGSDTQSMPCDDQESINYHGHDYQIIQIGEQCWFAENLRTTQWSNGDEIPQPLYVAGPESGIPACMPSFDEPTYGYWYNYGACVDSRDLCPSGFHVPTIDELESLLQFVSSPDELIYGPFNAGLAGLWYGNGNSFGYRAVFQSSTTLPPPNATINQQLMIVPPGLVEEWGETGITNSTIAAGCSVRCLKDAE